ncbi:SIS domain-containing protein [Bacillus sp. SM2101]|uniref:D-sedoheptulose-7-phosphate isomerase n=1 Tax=Bacillus sp. SM2101 TaxID=2805366 RepID=UPI001BDEE605|nr:SIS domain-containing protein [Bacillus sp. SM2101]
MKHSYYLNQVLNRYPELSQCICQINKSFILLKNAFHTKKKYLLCGNGGSSSDADHMVTELIKSFQRKRELPYDIKHKLSSLGNRGDYLAKNLESSIPAFSLSSQSAALTAIANDQGYNLTFSQQLIGYGNSDDVLIAFTTSGKSENVINAIYTAHTIGMKVICFTGNHAQFAGDHLCNVVINAPSKDTYRIQEYHLSIYHTLCTMLEKEVFF